MREPPQEVSQDEGSRPASAARLYTLRATLCALRVKVRSLKLFDATAERIRIRQKTIRHTPLRKLQDAFIAILAGAHGLVEVNTRLQLGKGERVKRVVLNSMSALGRACARALRVLLEAEHMRVTLGELRPFMSASDKFPHTNCRTNKNEDRKEVHPRICVNFQIVY